jgi:hypothetical protein
LREGLGLPKGGFIRHGPVLILTATRGQLLTGVILPKSARNLLYKHLPQGIIESLSVRHRGKTTQSQPHFPVFLGF